MHLKKGAWHFITLFFFFFFFYDRGVPFSSEVTGRVATSPSSEECEGVRVVRGVPLGGGGRGGGPDLVRPLEEGLLDSVSLLFVPASFFCLLNFLHMQQTHKEALIPETHFGG